MKEIIPAILPTDFEDLEGHVDSVKNVTNIVQVDICDGVFVPNTTWPYKGDSGEFEKIISTEQGLPMWEDVDYEIDLMVSNPKDMAKKWVEAGAKRIIFHVESGGVKEAIEMLKEDYMYVKEDDLLEVGVAINIDTPISALENIIDDVSVVQCMGIARIGYQHEKFDERVIGKIKEIRAKYPDIIVSIDGGVDFENVQKLLDAGVTRLIAGHSVFQGELEPKESVNKFNDILSA
ncbi:MAG: hypothetical protein WCO12_02685 [bacterium]